MSDPKLRALLTQLHSHLAQAKSLDTDARKRLTTTLHDIEHALGRPADSKSDSNAASGAPAKARLEALAVQFEADHPAVAGVMRQLIDALSSAGI